MLQKYWTVVYVQDNFYKYTVHFAKTIKPAI